MSLGKIVSVEEITDFKIKPIHSANGSGGSLGMTQMLNSMLGYSEMDGYKVTTDKHEFHVLIDNGQSCCESWGYICSEDDTKPFIGEELLEIKLTDTALNQTVLEESGYYEDEGGIQFVDFMTTRGVLQFAVYNSHNGYYGHGIVVAKDNEVLCNDIL